MDLKNVGEKAMNLLKKYRFVILVLVLGLILMMLPSKNWETETEDSLPIMKELADTWDITEELEQVLSQIQGVGEVKVLLTIATGEETIYQEDENLVTNETGSTIHKETVIISGSDRQEQALVSYVKPPTYLGAIIVCQGADQPSVKLEVMDAVAKITGLTSDKISVLKMK